MRIPVALICLVGTLAAGTYEASQVQAAASTPRQAPSLPGRFSAEPNIEAGPDISSGAASSLDWAGYAVSGGTFTKAAGSWVQPQITCSSKQTQRAAFWVGIDGFTTATPRTVQQIGTESDCVGGKASYYAWYQMYPTAAVVLSTSKYQVSSGETFTAQVSGSGKNFVLTISASVIGVTVWHYSVSQTLSTAPKANSAEWIAEAPCSGSPCTIAPLANFGTVDFSGIGSTGRASAKGFTDTEITMATKNSATIKARPSSLSSGGTAFSVTWAHS